MVETREVTREVDRQIEAIVAPLNRQLEEMEILQREYRKKADALADPIKRVRKLIKAAGGNSGRGPGGGTSSIGEETIAKVEAYLRANAEVINDDLGGISARELSDRMPGTSYDSTRRSLAALEERGLVHIAGKRTGAKGTAPTIYKWTEAPVV